jgi:hypothetical protein
VYRACIHCCQDLGQNDVIEPFPIGRRLAFDRSIVPASRDSPPRDAEEIAGIADDLLLPDSVRARVAAARYDVAQKRARLRAADSADVSCIG